MGYVNVKNGTKMLSSSGDIFICESFPHPHCEKVESLDELSNDRSIHVPNPVDHLPHSQYTEFTLDRSSSQHIPL